MKKQSVNVETIRDQIYEILKQEIIDCVLKPGDKLLEQTIADSLSVSRSPVREAIKQLTGDGLVINIPNKGAFVKKLTRKELSDMYDIRLMFECYAIQHALTNITKSDERQLVKIKEGLVISNREKDMKKYLKFDRDLHNLIISMSDNHIIISTYQNMCAMTNSFRSIALHSKKRFDDSLEEHTLLIDKILEGNVDEAVHYLTVHLTLAKETIQRYMDKNHMSDEDGPVIY